MIRATEKSKAERWNRVQGKGQYPDFIGWSLRADLKGDVEHRNADIWRKRTLSRGNTKHINILSHIDDSKDGS